MSALLNKRLARSLWRSKLRLFAVIFMVSVGVFAGLTFGGYSHNLSGMYDTMHADDDDGANLADLWIDNRSTTWSAEQVANFCQHLTDNWDLSAHDLTPVRAVTLYLAPCFLMITEKTELSIHFGMVSPPLPTATGFGCQMDTLAGD